MATDTKQLARDYLKRAGGYTDADIEGRKGQNGNYDIYVKGQYFGSGTPGQDGYISKNQSEWDSLYNQFQGKQNTNQYNQKSEQSNQLLDQYKQNIMQPIQPFTYDVNQIKGGAEYQAGLQSYLKDAESATNRGLTNLGRRGIGNSQSAVTMTTANQQNAYNQADQTMLPRLIAEQYQKYVDQNNMTRQQNQDMLGLAGVYGDQATDQRNFNYQTGRDQVADNRYNQEFEYQKGRDQRNDYESDRLFDYGIYRDNVGDEQWKKQFDQSVKAQAQQMGYNWASLGQRERQMIADQTARQEDKAYSQMQDRFSMGLQTFQQTGQMPDYMSAFGVNVEGLKNQETQAEVLGLMNDLATGAVQPEAALKMIEQAEKAGIKTGVVSTQLKNTVYDMFPEYSPESKAAQQKKTEQKQKLISDSIGLANYVPSFNLANKGYDWLKSQWSNYFGG